jgi:hypothetical protein
MHSAMITGDTQPWRVVVEIYTANNKSWYNKPSTQEKCIVKRIHIKPNLVTLAVLPFCIHTFLTASCHCWKHLWKPNVPPPPFFLVQLGDLLLHSIQLLLWTQKNDLWANFHSREELVIARCRSGEYSGGRMVRIWVVTKNCCEEGGTKCIVKVNDPTLSFPAFSTEWYPSNFSELWYEIWNSLSVHPD